MLLLLLLEVVEGDTIVDVVKLRVRVTGHLNRRAGFVQNLLLAIFRSWQTLWLLGHQQTFLFTPTLTPMADLSTKAS